MSNIFDINTLLSENTLATELLAKQFPSETYMFSAINSLNRFNESVLSMNKDLYKSLNEATSKSDENAIFGEFYKRYNSVLDKYINEINTMIGRFSITIDNLVDSNMSLINDQDVLGCDKEFTCTITRYKNLCGGKHPKFNPLEIYQREFNYIGQMMQDLGPIATDVAKLEVLATVSNQMCAKMKNKWLEKCIEEITDEDDCKDLTCYAKILNKLFVEEEEEITVNKGTIYAMKEEIAGYEKYKDAVLSIANKLISDFSYISNNIGGLFFRNKDNVLPIRSDKDGVESRDYQLDTYGMNQLDIFMKSKANQVSQLCSLYVIALSVMMDNIINYITQCKDVLEKVKDQCTECEPEPDMEEPSTDVPEDIGDEGEDSIQDDNGDGEPDELNIEDESPEEPETEDDSVDVDMDENNPFDIGDDEPEGEMEEGSEEPEEPEEPQEDTPEDGGDLDMDNNEFENESYLFEYMNYAVQNMLEQQELIDYVHTEILKEALEMPNGISKDNNLIENMLLAYNAIVDKFQRLFQEQNSKKAEFIKQNQNAFKDCKYEGYKITRYTPNNLYDLKIQQLNYEAMKNNLVSEEQFLKAYYMDISRNMAGQNGTKVSIKEAVTKLVVKDPNDMMEVNNTNVTELINFVVNYGARMNEIQKDQLTIKNAKAMSGRLIKSINNAANQQNNQQQQPQNASAYMTADDYLNEAIETGNAQNNNNQQNNNTGKAPGNDVKKQIQLFFSVSTKISSARMTMYNTAFKDSFNLLNSILSANGKPSYKNTKAQPQNNTAVATTNNQPQQ